jgi:hypothetical protein
MLEESGSWRTFLEIWNRVSIFDLTFVLIVIAR